MHCLETDVIKYISLSSVNARELNFQKLLLKKNAFCVVSLMSQTSELMINYEQNIPEGIYYREMYNMSTYKVYIHVYIYIYVLPPLSTPLSPNCVSHKRV